MNIIKNWKLTTKLIIAFLMISAISILIGAWGIFGMSKLSAEDERMYLFNTKPMGEIAVMYDTLASQRICANNMVIFLTADPTFSKEESESLTEKEELFDEVFKAYKTMLSNADEEALYASMETLYYNDFAIIKQQVKEAVASGDEASMVAAIKAMDDVGAEISGYMDEAFTLNDKLASEQVGANRALSRSSTVALIAIMAGGVLLSVLLAVFVSSLISRPLKRVLTATKQVGQFGDLNFSEEFISEIKRDASFKDELGQFALSFSGMMDSLAERTRQLEAVASGDLTPEVRLVSERDSIGNALSKMLASLNGMFGEVKSVTGQVALGSRQIANGAQTLAQGSAEQAAAVQELSSSIAEIAKSTGDNSNMASRAAEFSVKIRDNAQKGSTQMDQMTQAVREINEASQSISKVIKVIDDIAFQTNILALNAAVEAARAGQHGKGFAVVAEEVRNLAQKSAEAAKDTGDLIENSRLKAELGARIAIDTASSLADIVTGINESTQLVDDIARSSGEQSAAIQQITKGIDQVAQVVHQNSGTAQESAAASEDMSRQAGTLERLIARFKLNGAPQAQEQADAERASVRGGESAHHDLLESAYGKY